MAVNGHSVEEEEITRVSSGARALNKGYKLVIWYDVRKMRFCSWDWFIWGWGELEEARGEENLVT